MVKVSKISLSYKAFKVLQVIKVFQAIKAHQDSKVQVSNKDHSIPVPEVKVQVGANIQASTLKVLALSLIEVVYTVLQ